MTDTLSFTGGNVGIGTTSPTSPLHVENDGDLSSIAFFQNTSSTPTSYTNVIARSSAATRGAGYVLQDFSGTQVMNFNYDEANTQAKMTINENGTPLLFRMNNGSGFEAMRITSDGNVGIGETNPTDWLHINRTEDAQRGIRIENTTDRDWETKVFHFH